MKLQPPSPPRNRWNSPLTDYDLLTEESCKFLFEQCKTYLNETIEESEELTQRSARMVFLLLPAIGAIVGFVISNEDKFKKLNQFNLFLVLCFGVCLFNCMWLLISLFSAKNIHYKGATPEEMMRKEIFSLNDGVQIEKAIYVSEVERIQIKIEQMEFWNYERISNYASAIQSFLFMLGIGVVLLTRSI